MNVRWQVNGTVGVDVFFALSGWLITWLLLEEMRSAGAIDLKAFYIRRFFRIVPLYYFTIVVYAAAAALFFLATASSAKIQELREAIAYLLTFNSEYRSSEAGTVFGHAWTLGIEEKFYVVWPALIVIFANGYLARWFARRSAFRSLSLHSGTMIF
jgi:peptidoglycan/LPS O-acetylase OafA/YrhL